MPKFISFRCCLSSPSPSSPSTPSPPPSSSPSSQLLQCHHRNNRYNLNYNFNQHHQYYHCLNYHSRHHHHHHHNHHYFVESSPPYLILFATLDIIITSIATNTHLPCWCHLHRDVSVKMGFPQKKNQQKGRKEIYLNPRVRQ